MWSTYDANGNVLASFPLGYAFLSRTVILQGTTTYTVPSGTRAILVQCQGAGGQGGGVVDAATNSAGGGGGGSGAYSEKLILAPKLTAYTVAVGAGGTGASAANGNVGGDTTFDSPSVCTAKGGAGGLADTVTTIGVGGLGGAGGASASGVGDVKHDGQPGGAGLRLAAAQALGGFGAPSRFGGGANSIKTAGNGASASSLNYGGGGGGAVNLSSDANHDGGAGANGVIIVWEFA